MIPNPSEVKNILVIRNDRFGEFLLNIPALRALRETFCSAKIIAVVDDELQELTEYIPYIDEVMLWHRGRHFLLEKLSMLGILRKKNIDMAVTFNPSQDFNLITALCGIPIRVGYDRKWGFLLSHKIKDEKHLAKKHEVEYNLDLASLVGARTEDKALSLVISNDYTEMVIRKFNLSDYSNLVAVHPWTSDRIKQWPVNNFRELTQRLVEELGYKVLIIGGNQEVNAIAHFNNIGDKVINLCGKTTLKELAALLKSVKLLISGDSGPMHLACCVGTPVVAIFRNDMPAKGPQRWGPWGEGHVVIAKNKLEDITVDEVFTKIKNLKLKS